MELIVRSLAVFAGVLGVAVTLWGGYYISGTGPLPCPGGTPGPFRGFFPIVSINFGKTTCKSHRGMIQYQGIMPGSADLSPSA